MEIFEYLIIISSAFILASACGFRVFVPPLGLSLVYKLGIIELNDSWSWIGNSWVFLVLLIATLIEIFAYYLPWLDNFLDVISIPSAVAAGTLLSAISLDGINPGLQWFLAVIGGGSSAGLIQISSSSTRLTSSLMTGGFANPVISSIELLFAISIVILIFAFPAISLLLVFFLLLFLKKLLKKLKRRK
tara:strand:- start:88 stop:654 length:567 start_codon:yes stop_codon:yes gene_type:complete